MAYIVTLYDAEGEEITHDRFILKETAQHYADHMNAFFADGYPKGRTAVVTEIADSPREVQKKKNLGLQDLL